jgi:GMP reductase
VALKARVLLRHASFRRGSREDEIASISLGIKEADYAILERFRKAAVSPDYITVDVAHGDSEEVIRIVKTIRSLFSTVFIIAGNVATVEGAQRLADAGADAVKVGIGPGMACLTAPNTGFGSRGWQLSAVAQVSEALDASHPRVKIIADGGIRSYGDIAKSIAFGADMVMIGGMLSGHDENPGEVLEMDGEYKKAFFGSASEHQKGEHKHVEGQRLYMPYKGSLATTLQIIKENLQSSVSYAGGKQLDELRQSGYVKLK